MTAAWIAAGVTTTAGLAMVGGLIAAIVADPGRPVTPPWTPGQLAEPPPFSWTKWVDENLGNQKRCVNPSCGRHCAGCTEPARITSTATRHIARHCMDEIPPSLRWLAERVEVCFRATLITAELVGRHVTRPADGTAFRLWAARKLGRPLQLGATRKMVLP